jgi:hypothetical protein
MSKIDFKKTLAHLYRASAKKVAFVEVPRMQFLMIEGRGDPNASPAFGEAVEALYSVSYTVKFAVKRQEGTDYVVPPLEGLWWADEPVDLWTARREDWRWIAMIMQPDFVTAEMVEAAIAEAKRKKGLEALKRLRFEPLEEGPAAQILHVGPYAEEGPTIERLHEAIRERGLVPRGKHHEIYLADPRRTAPERLRTILRHPVGEG